MRPFLVGLLCTAMLLMPLASLSFADSPHYDGHTLTGSTAITDQDDVDDAYHEFKTWVEIVVWWLYYRGNDDLIQKDNGQGGVGHNFNLGGDAGQCEIQHSGEGSGTSGGTFTGDSSFFSVKEWSVDSNDCCTWHIEINVLGTLVSGSNENLNAMIINATESIVGSTAADMDEDTSNTPPQGSPIQLDVDVKCGAEMFIMYTVPFVVSGETVRKSFKLKLRCSTTACD